MWGLTLDKTQTVSLLNQGCYQELGAGDFPQLLWMFPCLLSWENRRKIEPKEIPSCLIPHLLAVFNWELEILVTYSCTCWTTPTLKNLHSPKKFRVRDLKCIWSLLFICQCLSWCTKLLLNKSMALFYDLNITLMTLFPFVVFFVWIIYKLLDGDKSFINKHLKLSRANLS